MSYFIIDLYEYVMCYVLMALQLRFNSFSLSAVYTISFSKVLLIRIIYYFILYVLISLINSADSIIRCK